jgi:nucleosome binding factor SPN SPT16 subunit
VKAAELLIKEYNYYLEFDVPFKDLEFTGCHAKASVNIVPTSQCLIALSEAPFLIQDISDIEVAHFERV